MRTINEGWESFEKAVIPAAASVHQRTEMRMAFYAGVHHLICILHGIGDTAISEDAGVGILEGLYYEFNQFARSMIDERAIPVPTAQGRA